MKRAIGHRVGITTSPEMLAAEEAGHALLHSFCRAKQGNQAALARKTDLLPATVSKMCSGVAHISIEAALLFDVATDGALPAEKLCPSRADLLAQFLQLRTAAAIDNAA